MEGLTNHEITICLKGGAVLGPYRGTWTKEMLADVRELSREYDAYLQGQPQKRYKFHLHDQEQRLSHSLIINFDEISAIYDRVELTD